MGDIPYILQGKYFSIIEKNKLSVKADCVACKKSNPNAKPISGAINATSNFLIHLKRKHPHLCASYEQEKKKRLHSGRNQSTVTNFIVVNETKSVSRYEKAIMDFIVKGMHPLSTVEQPGFIEMLKVFNPEVKGISRKRLTGLINSQFGKLKEDIAAKIEKFDYVCITADAWTSTGKQRGFLGVTAHWINDSLERESAALACRRFTGSHTHDRIAELLNRILTEYRIPVNKITKAVTDNGANFVKAFFTYASLPEMSTTNENDDLDAEIEDNIEFQEVAGTLSAVPSDELLYQLPPHQRCASHTLSLICTSDLKNLSGRIHRSAMAKCQGIWNRVGKSTVCNEKVLEICKKSLVRPCASRWNSLYDSILCLIGFENVFDDICEATNIAKFSSREITYLKEFIICVKPVAEELDKLQGENNMYYGKLLPGIRTVERKLIEIVSQPMSECTNVAKILLNALRKRFTRLINLEETDPIIAALSHPYFKLRWIPDEKLAELQNMFIEVVKQEADKRKTNLESESVSRNQCDIDNYYGFAPSQQVSDVSLHMARDECYRYFQDANEDLSMLSAYPNVLSVFKKYNTALPSSAAVERLFSYSNMILEPTRRRLTDEHFEMLTLMKVN